MNRGEPSAAVRPQPKGYAEVLNQAMAVALHPCWRFRRILRRPGVLIAAPWTPG